MRSPAIAFLLVAPFDPSLFSNSCLSQVFYGNYQDGRTMLSVFRPDTSCLTEWTSRTPALSASFTEAPSEGEQLVWLAEAVIDPSLNPGTLSSKDGFTEFLATLQEPLFDNGSSAQKAMTFPHSYAGYKLLYHSSRAALLSVSREKANVIDTLLPRFWKSTLLPSSPTSYQPVPPSALKPVEDVLSRLRFDPVIASLVDSLSITQMKNDIRFLTGEDGRSGIVSRHSFSPGALTAVSWLKQRFEETGAACGLQHFLHGFAPNVVWCAASLYPDSGLLNIRTR